jgi:hypothetical protein
MQTIGTDIYIRGRLYYLFYMLVCSSMYVCIGVDILRGIASMD